MPRIYPTLCTKESWALQVWQGSGLFFRQDKKRRSSVVHDFSDASSGWKCSNLRKFIRSSFHRNASTGSLLPKCHALQRL